MLPRKGIATVLCELLYAHVLQWLQEMLPRKGIATQATSLGILFL